MLNKPKYTRGANLLKLVYVAICVSIHHPILSLHICICECVYTHAHVDQELMIALMEHM